MSTKQASKAKPKAKTKAKAETETKAKAETPTWAPVVAAAIKAANDGAHEIDRATYVAYLMIEAGHLPKTPRKKGSGLDWTATDATGQTWDTVDNGLQVDPAVMGDGCILAHWLIASGETPTSPDDVRAIRKVNGMGTQPLYRPVIAILRAQAVKSPGGKTKRAAIPANYTKAMARPNITAADAAAATAKAAGVELPKRAPRKPKAKTKAKATVGKPLADYTVKQLIDELHRRGIKTPGWGPVAQAFRSAVEQAA